MATDSDALISQFAPKAATAPSSGDPDSLIGQFAPREPGLKESAIPGVPSNTSSIPAAMWTGFKRGASWGYTPESPEEQEAAAAHPLATGFMAFAPGAAEMKLAEMGLGKGLSYFPRVASALKYLGNLPGASTASNLATGFGTGYAYNPGQRGNRVENGLVGAGTGLGLGVVGNLLDRKSVV